MSMQVVYKLYCDNCGSAMAFEGLHHGIYVEGKEKDSLHGTMAGSIGVYRCNLCDNVYLIPKNEEPLGEWLCPLSL